MPPSRPRFQGIFQLVEAGQVLGDVIRIAADPVTFVEEFRQVVTQLDAGDSGEQENYTHGEDHEQGLAPAR